VINLSSKCLSQTMAAEMLAYMTKILDSFRKYAGKIKKHLNRLCAQNLFCCHFCHSKIACNVLRNN
ncbi:hypothetical protein, partial [Prevotella pallens]|uniref:hypothetical protein n=1 Tax=Prevotella pallens TaxID=60133 RepID=UPI0023F157AD